MKRLYIFEGLDGCGKSTQVKMLADHLNILYANTQITVLREPGGNSSNEYIRDWLKTDKSLSPEHQLLLFCLARKNITDDIDKYISMGHIVILDRYLASTYAYQQASGIPIETLNKYTMDICPLSEYYAYNNKYTTTFYLDISAEKVYDRIVKRGINENDPFEKLEYLNKVEKCYKDFLGKIKNVKNIDATKDIDTIHKQILENL